MPEPQEILKFWFESLTPEDHFRGGDRVDELIRSGFHGLWMRAAGGGLAEWENEPRSALALIIVLDQFPRNMFRGSGQSFHSDALAREIAGNSLAGRFDMHFDERRRLFFYMPFMHSERLHDQDRCIDCIAARMRKTGAQNLLHARAHRRIIKRFGRFPYRNEVLGRPNTSDEDDWLASSGYIDMVAQIEAEGSA